MQVHLAFVVGGATSEEVAIAHCGFKGRRGPELQRLGGLHVVMSVKKNGGLAGSVERFGVHQRVHVGGNDFDGLESGGAQLVRNPVRGAFNVRLVLAFGADAGDAQEFAKLGKMRVAMIFNKVGKIHSSPRSAYFRSLRGLGTSEPKIWIVKGHTPGVLYGCERKGVARKGTCKCMKIKNGVGGQAGK